MDIPRTRDRDRGGADVGKSGEGDSRERARFGESGESQLALHGVVWLKRHVRIGKYLDMADCWAVRAVRAVDCGGLWSGQDARQGRAVAKSNHPSLISLQNPSRSGLPLSLI